MDAIKCEIRFQELINKYLRVLTTAKTPYKASLAFRCFDMLNDIDFEQLSEPKHRLITELKHKLMIASETNDSDVSEDPIDQPIRVKIRAKRKKKAIKKRRR